MVTIYIRLVTVLHNSLLLLKRHDNATIGKNLYTLPGGECMYNETPTQAVIREAHDELNIIVHPSDLQLVHTLSFKSDNGHLILLFFTTKHWSGNAHIKKPDKHSQLLWAPLDTIPTNTMPTHQQALENIQKNNVYSEYGW